MVFFPKDNGCYESISVGDIVCVEVRRDKCIVCLSDGTQRCLPCPMQDVEAVLPPRTFIKVHRSHIVNINFIHYYYYGFLVMSNDKEVPIGKSYINRWKFARLDGE